MTDLTPGDEGVPLARAIVPWRKPPEVEEHERKTLAAKNAIADAQLAKAEAAKKHAEILRVGADLVLKQLQKLLSLAEHADFANAPGPLEPKDVIKLAEFLNKNYRLDNGQATENIAMAIGPSIDFGKLSQEERDQWRALAVKGGGNGE